MPPRLCAYSGTAIAEPSSLPPKITAHKHEKNLTASSQGYTQPTQPQPAAPLRSHCSLCCLKSNLDLQPRCGTDSSQQADDVGTSILNSVISACLCCLLLRQNRHNQNVVRQCWSEGCNRLKRQISKARKIIFNQ